MEKRILGRTNIEVSIITFSGIVVKNTTSQKAAELVDLAIDIGINYFDVAPIYGNAQYMLGPALEKYRKDIYLACKTEERTAEGSKKDLLESLSALKTDYFDLYQFHGVDSFEEVETIFAEGGAMETFEWALANGITKHIGFTCHHNEIAMEMFRRNDKFETMLFPVNYAYRHKLNESVEPLIYCKENNIGVIAIKALAERAWRENERTDTDTTWYKPINNDPDLARIALNYTLTIDGVTTCPPPGNEAMLRLAFDIIGNQGGKPIVPTEQDLKKLFDFADTLSLDDMLF